MIYQSLKTSLCSLLICSVVKVLPFQECRRVLQFGNDSMNDSSKDIVSPLIMMRQTPIIVSMA